MIRTRVIPCLLLMNGRLVKTIKFKKPTYVGDPMNIVKIFNTKEVDEIVFLDITATLQRKRPNFQLLEEISSECFMPVAYGGGITTLDDVKSLFKLGIEKVILNTITHKNPTFVSDVANYFGSQSIIVSIDVRKNILGQYHVFTHCGKQKINIDPVTYAKLAEKNGAGEILLTSMNCDGMMRGYDIALIKMVTEQVSIPVIACGGACEVSDLATAVHLGHASAVAAGSMVVYQGKNRAVLTKFPKREELKKWLP